MAAAARGSLRQFLAAARLSLHQAISEQKPVHFVVGNESCDLDSTTSAILYAYLNSSTSHNKQPPQIHIPLLNIPRADIAIRPELLWLLPHAGLTPECLLTLSDVPGLIDDEPSPAPSQQPQKQKQLSIPPHLTYLTLVDHNAPTGPLLSHYFFPSPSTSTLSPSSAPQRRAQICACIDHHIDESFTPSSASPRIIQTAGSCTSLVLQSCVSTWDLLSTFTSTSSTPAGAQDDASHVLDDDSVRRGWDAQIAKFALASVLVDTQGLRDKGKTTEVDEWAVRYLEATIVLAEKGGERWDREGFLEGLVRAKGDLEGLSVEDVLRKDYKEWIEGERKLGFASCVRSLKWLIQKVKGGRKKESDSGGDGQLVNTLKAFAEKRGLDIVAVATTFTDEEGGFRRELLIWTPKRGKAADKGESTLQDFAKKGEHELRLEEWKEEDIDPGQDGSLRVWWVRDVSKSRKQVGPLLRSVMKDV